MLVIGVTGVTPGDREAAIDDLGAAFSLDDAVGAAGKTLHGLRAFGLEVIQRGGNSLSVESLTADVVWIGANSVVKLTQPHAPGGCDVAFQRCPLALLGPFERLRVFRGRDGIFPSDVGGGAAELVEHASSHSALL